MAFSSDFRSRDEKRQTKGGILKFPSSKHQVSFCEVPMSENKVIGGISSGNNSNNNSSNSSINGDGEEIVIRCVDASKDSANASWARLRDAQMVLRSGVSVEQISSLDHWSIENQLTFMRNRETIAQDSVALFLKVLKILSIPCNSDVGFNRRILFPACVGLFLWGYWVGHIVVQLIADAAEGYVGSWNFSTGWLAMHILIAYIHAALAMNFRAKTMLNEITAIDYSGMSYDDSLWVQAMVAFKKDLRIKLWAAVVAGSALYFCILQGEIETMLFQGGSTSDTNDDLSRVYVFNFHQPLAIFIIRAVTLPFSLAILSMSFMLFHLWLKIHEMSLDALTRRLVHREIFEASAILEHQRIVASIKRTSLFFQRWLVFVIIVLSTFSFESIWLLTQYVNDRPNGQTVGIYLFITLWAFGVIYLVFRRGARLTSKCKSLLLTTNSLAPEPGRFQDHALLVQYLHIANPGFTIFGVKVAYPNAILAVYILAYVVFFAFNRFLTCRT